MFTGASPEPYITVNQTKDRSLLQCEVRGASPKPEVEWWDSSGTILPAVETLSTEKEGSFYMTLQTNVTQSGHYRCVVTQLKISHRIHAETNVYIPGEILPSVDLICK